MLQLVSIKLAVLIPVVFATWFLTSEIMVRAHHAPSANLDGGSLVRVKVSDMQGQPPLPKGAKRIDRRVVSSSSLNEQNISVHGNDVTITASADLMNQDTTVMHLWRLRAYNEAGIVEIDKPYTEQIFKMHESGQITPTFAERIQLPAGKHQIILTLYSLPKSYNFKDIDVETKPQPGKLVHVPKTIFVE